MSDGPEWFAPRRRGIGTGVPISWQGWLLSLALIAALGLAYWMFGNNNPKALAILVPAILIYVIIAARTTKGGLRWRWGDDE
ncbi:hypothetical protein ABDK56_09020 [Sphingomonas sp. ASV193]|uniref:hypothetical protein n=1 Tax=Sphingomonas sp. ASV193 TaxID=3144405 RepID=UPI0032E8B52F